VLNRTGLGELKIHKNLHDIFTMSAVKV